MRSKAAAKVCGNLQAVAPILTDKLLEIAAQIEADELRIKQFILHAASKGDLATVIATINRWLVTPPGEVLENPVTTT